MDEPELTQADLATNAETWKHIDLVMQLLANAQIELMRRQFTHDRSKLTTPEVSTFTEYTPKLAGSTYGSEEYKQFLQGMKPALDHHYSKNRHHPEFHAKGSSKKVSQMFAQIEKLERLIGSGLDDSVVEVLKEQIKFLQDEIKVSTSRVSNMNLFDLLEMLIDWYAATKRHNDGNIYRSVEINRDRFDMSDQLARIFLNTIPWIQVNEFDRYRNQADLEYELFLKTNHIDRGTFLAQRDWKKDP
jgi:membrane-associated HD superfamily phosphohydrolase